MRLEGKVAVVTGAAQGIGRAIALGLGREGARVVTADLQLDKTQSVAAELQSAGAEALAQLPERPVGHARHRSDDDRAPDEVGDHAVGSSLTSVRALTHTAIGSAS